MPTIATAELEHPGRWLKAGLLPLVGVTVSEAASLLAVDRVTLSRLINQRAGVSPAMALRLERWLGAVGGGTAAEWLARQAAHDIDQAESGMRAELRAIKPAKLIGG